MTFGQRLKKMWRGDEELRVTFWKFLLPFTIAFHILAVYGFWPLFGWMPTLALVFLWLIAGLFFLCRNWHNSSASFQDEFRHILKFGMVLWFGSLIMLPVLYLVYRHSPQ